MHDIFVVKGVLKGVLMTSAPPRRPNSFVMITANRVLHCTADTPEEMHHWITLLQRSKGDTRVDGQEFVIRGDEATRPPGLVLRGRNRSDCNSSRAMRSQIIYIYI